MTKYRTVWISDVHLGTRGCKAELLLQFLKKTKTDKLYLIGDIIDLWKMQAGWYWPASHNEVIQKLITMSRSGTKNIYVPGNHDEFFRDHLDLTFGNIELRQDDVHVCANGKRMLVIHGDEFDILIRE